MPAAIDRLETYLFRVPLQKPRINSFGKMTHRAALIVRLIDRDGAEGWGECFCNWPAFAAEHRFRVLTELIAPRLAGQQFDTPQAVTQFMTSQLRILRIQSDERGPFDQAVAAVDLAAWDLTARRQNVPLYRALGAREKIASVPYYASGLSPDQAVKIAESELAIGTRAFKGKVGWGTQADVVSVAELRAVIGPETVLMVDANQKWDMAEAKATIKALTHFNLAWIEEPIPADHPAQDFAALAELGVPIAAGENIRGAENFSGMMTAGRISVVQPDIIKWGGISSSLSVARQALDAGLRYCPHYLGGGVGLIATAHLLAAMGGDGMLELDATPNPLRPLLADPFPILSDGMFLLPQGPGLGVTPDLNALAAYRQMPQNA